VAGFYLPDVHIVNLYFAFEAGRFLEKSIPAEKNEQVTFVSQRKLAFTGRNMLMAL
jgi:hypothetical protein